MMWSASSTPTVRSASKADSVVALSAGEGSATPLGWLWERSTLLAPHLSAFSSLILLDIVLPDISGVDLCLQIRNKVAAPILFMSCKSEEIDKIIALSVGGDDYITKPFNSGELIARIKAHLRRERRARQAEAERNPVYECRGLEVDETARTVQLDGQPVNVTTKEFDILLTLIRSPKRVFSMDQLFELVWKEESLAGDSRTIMVYISNIRKKIEKEDQKFIYNIRGAGYKFHDEVTVRSR